MAPGKKLKSGGRGERGTGAWGMKEAAITLETIFAYAPARLLEWTKSSFALPGVCSRPRPIPLRFRYRPVSSVPLGTFRLLDLGKGRKVCPRSPR